MTSFLHAAGGLLVGLLLSIATTVQAADADSDTQTASYAIETGIKLTTDQRNRGISDSLLQPAARLNLQLAHESGLIGLLELSTVSKKQFLNGDGYSMLLAGGWRFGDPEGWHFGVGAVAELFPRASFEAPHAFDVDTGLPFDSRRTKFDSTLALFELGYGALEMRALSTLSKNYRGANTGSVCGTLLQTSPDPTVGLNCYARGDHNSRGTLLADADYKIPLAPQTTLNLHAGLQRVKNFKEADAEDYAVSITHRRWGFDFSAEWLHVNTRAHELFLVQDGDKLRATDSDKLVLTVSRKF